MTAVETTVVEDWDGFRATMHTPVGIDRPPAIVFCHGLGGDHRHYAELTAGWAAHGFLVVQPQFADSAAVVAVDHPELGIDPADREGRWMADPDTVQLVLGLLFDPEHWRRRVAIVRRILDDLPTDRVGVGGHSYGAYTAQLLCGARVTGHDDFADPRVRAGLLMSPQGSGGGRGLTPDSWSAITQPLHIVTATNDQGARGEGLAWKREPYDGATAAERYLTIIEGGDHGLGGIAHPGLQRRWIDDAPTRDALAAVTTAFWRLALNDDATARSWLRTHPFAPLLTHEHRFC